MSDDFDWVAAAAKRAKGKRPEFFDEPAVDRLTSIVMAVVGEVAVLRQRLDTVERLLDSGQPVTRDAIERYTPDADAAYERGVATKTYISRVMRGVTQAMEAMESDDKPVEEVSRDLREM